MSFSDISWNWNDPGRDWSWPYHCILSGWCCCCCWGMDSSIGFPLRRKYKMMAMLLEKNLIWKKIRHGPSDKRLVKLFFITLDYSRADPKGFEVKNWRRSCAANYFFILQVGIYWQNAYHLKLDFWVPRRYQESAEKWVWGKLNKVFLHFLPIFLAYFMIF